MLYILLLLLLLPSCMEVEPIQPTDYSRFTNSIKITKDSSFGVWFEHIDSNEYNLIYQKNTYSFYKKIYAFSDFTGYVRVSWLTDSLLYTNHVNVVYWNPDSTLYDYDFPVVKIPMINKTSIDTDGEFETIFGINRSYAYIDNKFTDLTISDLIKHKVLNKTIYIRVYMYDYIRRDTKNNSPVIHVDSLKINFVER